MKDQNKIEQEIENYSKYIAASVRAEDASNSIEDKIDLLAMIISSKDKILRSNVFYEEDCLFSILNWVWEQRENFTEENFIKEFG